MRRYQVPISVLAGQYITSVVEEDHGQTVVFNLRTGDRVILTHNQDCCESVGLEDVAGGELEEITGHVYHAEERSNTSDPPPEDDGGWSRDDGIYLWTFYEIRTTQGSYTLRFYGTSNGYYSVSVDCYLVVGEPDQ